MPFVIATGGAGTLEPGRFLQYDRAPTNRLLVSIGQAMGLEDLDSFGDTDPGGGGLAGLTSSCSSWSCCSEDPARPPAVNPWLAPRRAANFVRPVMTALWRWSTPAPNASPSGPIGDTVNAGARRSPIDCPSWRCPSAATNAWYLRRSAGTS